jgi:hypothetical protein
MTKNRIIAFLILAVTFILPFRYAVMDVKSSNHALSALGILFSGIGIVAGFYFLVKDDKEKSH